MQPRIPKRHKKIQTSRLDFKSYLYLRAQAERNHYQLGYAVQQHDNDKITYDDAYSLLREAVAQSKTYTSQMSGVYMDIFSGIFKLLTDKHILTRPQANKIINHAMKRL